MLIIDNHAHLSFTLFPTNLPTSRLILMWTLMGKFEDKPITNLAKAAATKRGFSTAFLLPDNWDVLDAHNTMEMEHNERVNRMLFKEDTQKHNKANSQVLYVKTIHHRTESKGAYAKMSVLLNTVTKLDTMDTKDNESPFLHIAARHITLTISLVLF